MNISQNELRLLIRALEKAASRHESQGRSTRYGRHHDAQAAAMRKLRTRLFDLQPKNLEKETCEPS